MIVVEAVTMMTMEQAESPGEVGIDKAAGMSLIDRLYRGAVDGYEGMRAMSVPIQ